MTHKQVHRFMKKSFLNLDSKNNETRPLLTAKSLMDGSAYRFFTVKEGLLLSIATTCYFSWYYYLMGLRPEHTGFYIFLLAMGWIVGGFYEEIIFHGFIFTRIEKMIPGKYAVVMGFLLTNIIFAFYHIQLGTAGVINAFFAGSAYHALILYYKRNMWYAVFCHAVFDTIALTFMYAGY